MLSSDWASFDTMIVAQMITGGKSGYDDPSSLGIESAGNCFEPP